jgi:hypothetical protein
LSRDKEGIFTRRTGNKAIVTSRYSEGIFTIEKQARKESLLEGQAMKESS